MMNTKKLGLFFAIGLALFLASSSEAAVEWKGELRHDDAKQDVFLEADTDHAYWFELNPGETVNIDFSSQDLFAVGVCLFDSDKIKITCVVAEVSPIIYTSENGGKYAILVDNWTQTSATYSLSFLILERANLIVPCESNTGNFSFYNDWNAHRLRVESGETAIIRWREPIGIGTYMGLYDLDGNCLAEGYLMDNLKEIKYNFTNTGDYSILVRGGAPSTYELSVVIIPKDFTGERVCKKLYCGDDPTPIDLGVVDAYTFEAQTGTSVTISTRNTQLSYYPMVLYDAEGDFLAESKMEGNDEHTIVHTVSPEDISPFTVVLRGLPDNNQHIELICSGPGPCSCPDSDGDGVPDAWDQCPGTPTGLCVDNIGCSDPCPDRLVPVTCDLTPDTTSLSLGDLLGLDVKVRNTTNVEVRAFYSAQVTEQGSGNTVWSSEPITVLLNPFEEKFRRFEPPIPSSFSGDYRYEGYLRNIYDEEVHTCGFIFAVYDSLWNIRVNGDDFFHSNEAWVRPWCSSEGNNCGKFEGGYNYSFSWTHQPHPHGIGKASNLTWVINPNGNLTVHGARDHQWNSWTYVYVDSPKTLIIPWASGNGTCVPRFFVNGYEDSEPYTNPIQYVDGNAELFLEAGWNRIDITGYNQNDSFSFDLNFDLVGNVDRMSSRPLE